MTTWRAVNAGWLALALERLRLRLNRRALWSERPDGCWLLGGDDESAFYAADATALAIDARIAEIELRIAAVEHAMGDEPPALRVLSLRAGLTRFEEALLLCAAAPSLDGGFAHAYAQLQQDPLCDHVTLQLVLGLELERTEDRVLAADALLPRAALRRLALLEVGAAEPLLTTRLGVDHRLADWLRGVNRLDSRLEPLLSPLDPAPATPWSETTAAELAATLAGRERWSTLNLVGSIEGGAGELARGVCERLGQQLLRLDATRLADYDDRSALYALLAREALLADLALLVEGAGPLVDELIAELPATLFVVSAESLGAGATVDSVAVTPPSRGEQAGLWRSVLTTPLNGTIDAIVQQFDFGPPTIAAAAARAAARGDVTERALWRACREQRAAALDDLAERVTPCFGWDDIVVGEGVIAQLHELAAQVRHRARVHEVWGFGAQLGRGRGVTALFAGESGTGKTMAAEILAAELDLDLYRIDLAGIVSKYIGETEKNLRRVFDAAQQIGAILFFDEADALFGKRTEVRDSHDRYANVEINYLLQRMEDYAGVAILATNRRAALDSAFLRRLRFVIEFAFPGADARRRIWELMFPAAAEVGALRLGALARLELSGGSIRSIALNAAFLAAADAGPIEMEHVMRAAGREFAKLSRPVSAAEFGEFQAVAGS